jgi:nucleotide-binding universal stress UspA family protein
MVEKVLVPVDGSSFSESILGRVRGLLSGAPVEVVLVRVLDESGTDGSQAADRAEAQAYLDSLKRHLVERGARVRCQVRTGDPAAEILACEREEEPALIAMSLHGRGGLDRWIRGSVAERVLRESHRPVLLANPRSRDASHEREDLHGILVPLDGTIPSTEALPLAEFVARAHGSEILLLHVTSPGPTLSPTDATNALAARHLEPHRRRLESRGIRARVLVDSGNEAGGILRAAQEQDVGLVVMTTHGRSGISRWAFGSVSELVLRHCPIPVLVVRTAGHVALAGSR